MDQYQIFKLFLRSSSHDGEGEENATGNGSDHSDGDHHDQFGHANPGTVLFLFVAIAVGGEYAESNYMYHLTVD